MAYALSRRIMALWDSAMSDVESERLSGFATALMAEQRLAVALTLTGETELIRVGELMGDHVAESVEVLRRTIDNHRDD